MATTGSAHRAVKCALNSHKAPLVARFVSVGVSCRCASDGNIDYYARPGMCIIELPPAINIPKFCRAHFILLIYPCVSGPRVWTCHDNTLVQRESRCRSRSLSRVPVDDSFAGKFVYSDRYVATGCRKHSIGYSEYFQCEFLFWNKARSTPTMLIL